MKRVEGAVELELEEKKEETGVTLPDVPHQLTHSLLDHSPCFCAWNICRSHQSNTRFREPDPLYSAIFNQHSYFLFPIRVTILKFTLLFAKYGKTEKCHDCGGRGQGDDWTMSKWRDKATKIHLCLRHNVDCRVADTQVEKYWFKLMPSHFWTHNM